MTTRITSLIGKSTTSILRLALLSSLVTAPLFAADNAATKHSTHEQPSPATLVQLVRDERRSTLTLTMPLQPATDHF